MIRGFLIAGLMVGMASIQAARAEDAAHADKGHADPVLAEHPDPTGDDAAGGAHSKAKPDLPLKFQADLALWSLVTFLVFLVVLSKLAWKPLINGMNAREAKIRQDIADAESHRVKAEAMLRDYQAKLAKSQEEVKEILAEARRDAGHAKQEILAIAEKESAAMRQRAVSDIERARDQALNDLFDFVSQNVMQATEQVVGRSLTGPDHERLVREALTNLDLRKN